MTEASLVVQKCIRDTLIADTEITSRVPAADIADRGGLPEAFPCIDIGQATVTDITAEIGVVGVREQVITDLHIFVREPSLTAVRHIAGAVKRCLHHQRFNDVEGFLVVDLFVESARFLRDPDGVTAHGVVTVRSRVEWRLS